MQAGRGHALYRLGLGAAVVAVTVLAATGPGDEGSRAEPAEGVGNRIYQRRQTLAESLLATRARYDTWLKQQARARAGLQCGAWTATAPLPLRSAEESRFPETGVDLDAKGTDGKPLWSPHPEWTDTRTPLNLAAETPPVRSVAVYLTRTLTAAEAGPLTIGLGGGDHLAAWLNGQPVVATVTTLGYERYGTSLRPEGHPRQDQVQVDLPLVAGENRLLVRLYQADAGPHSPLLLWSSLAPDPVPDLWAQVRVDFPPAANHVLELVDALWFAPGGWLAAGARTDLEQALVRGLAEELGGAAEPLRQRLAELTQAQAPPTDPRWLALCVTAAEFAAITRERARLTAAVEDLYRSFPEQYPGRESQARLEKHGVGLFERVATESAQPRGQQPLPVAAELEDLRRDLLVTGNPLLKGAELAFVRRYTYDSMHYYDDYYNGVRRFGGNLCVLSLDTGRVRQLVPELEGGIFDRYDLSPDGRRLVFGYRAHRAEGYRLYEIGLDGTGLRQLTFAPPDEAARITRYSLYPLDALKSNPALYGHWTDDLHPCYLPDGGVAFVSTRQEHSVLCGGHSLTATNLFRIEADGQGLRPLSRGALSEFTPTLLQDGRILYNRWEYVYKGIAAIQPLWAMRPDGSGSEEVYGDNIADPGVFVQARQVPGLASRYVCTACGHEPLAVGAILLLDLTREKRTRAPMTSLTPEVETRGLRGIYHRRNGQWRADDIDGPLYCDPYPLADPVTHAGAGRFFLVVCNPDKRYNHPSAYGLYLLDVYGNRVPIHTDPEMSCFQPMVLRPRPGPPVLPSATPAPGATADAILVVADVYQGLSGVRPGTIKYLRVLEQVPRPWSAWQGRPDDGISGQMVAVSYFTHIWIAVLLGVVPVREDGSACFRVPAGRNLFLQALDQDYLAVQTMRTFISLEPGERRACVGCHEVRRQAPPSSRRLLAPRDSPDELQPQPGEVAPRPLDYAADVQPVLDRRCGGCHGGAEPKANLNLGGELTEHFCRSYEELLSKGLVNVIREWTGPALPTPPSYFTVGGAMAHAPAVPPYTYGSHQSKLITVLRQGHHGVQLAPEEFVRLATWVDTNAPYYGSYFGRRNLRYRKHPDFRPTPTLASARGVLPPVVRPAPVPARLLGWWKLDASADPGVATDASGGGHDGRIVGATWDPGPDGGSALTFAGTGYVEIGDLGEFETLSVGLWVRAGALKNRWSPLLFVNEFNPMAFHLSLLTDGAVNLAINSAGTHIHRRSNRTVNDGQWHHLAVVCDTRYGGTVRFFIDGKQDAEHPLDAATAVALHGLRLGGWNQWQGQPDNNYHGAMADVRVYAGMLSPPELADLARARPTAGR